MDSFNILFIIGIYDGYIVKEGSSWLKVVVNRDINTQDKMCYLVLKKLFPDKLRDLLHPGASFRWAICMNERGYVPYIKVRPHRVSNNNLKSLNDHWADPYLYWNPWSKLDISI